MPVVIFFACLDLEQKPLVMDGHYIKILILKIPNVFLWLKEKTLFFVQILANRSKIMAAAVLTER